MASGIDSLTWGTLIGTAAIGSFLAREGDGRPGRLRRDQVRDGGPDGGLHQFLLLAVVDRVRARGRAGAGVAADVLEVVAGQLPEPGVDERPAAHVLRLLLAPDPLAGRPVTAERRLEHLGGPGKELLEPDDRDLAVLV